MKYNISTYNASELIADVCEKQDSYGNFSFYYSIDYTNRRNRRRYIKATCKYSDTALFYQIRKVLEEENMPFNNDIDKYLIFVDFDRLFDKVTDGSDKSAIIEKKLKDLFKNGVYIHYENQDIHYMPYEKSNSMARESKMSFINTDIKDKLDQRLTLDIDFSKINLQLSKYYAYKGLYLSSATRIESEEMILNSKRVIIIDDDVCKCENKKVITAEPDDSLTKWTIKDEIKHLKLKVFDGEGIISPEYSDIINNVQINGKKVFIGAASYQIRMPFVKGMLHRVDFKKFIREYANAEDAFIIKDAFGIERNILEADIIMPVSMFKCMNWIEQDKSYDIDKYFMSLKKYDHALYISNTDIIYGNTSDTTLNYQILNTLSLTDSEMDELIENHLERVRNPMEYKEDWKEKDIKSKWKYALSVNPVFSHERKIQSMLSMVSKSRKDDIVSGKIFVKGEVRYLSRDLLSFLVYILKLGKSENYKMIKQNCIFEDEFFMPQNKISLEIKKHYPVFRNPHLSRNEQCALKPYFKGKDKSKNDIYYRYFGHLKGVVMVSYSSLAPLALGGADFDGDTVRIIDDNRVRNAVIRGVYEKNPESKGPHYIRKIPVVDIPSVDSAKANQQRVKSEISYDVIKNTFSNRIGIISNLAISIGRMEYSDNNTGSQHTCAECTILTGLEIDAAKHGIHPCLDEITNIGKGGKKTEFSDYLGFKEFIDNLKHRQYFISDKHISRTNDILKISVGKNKESTVKYKLSDDIRGVDKLPLYYADHINEKFTLPGEKTGSKYIYFDFLSDNSWKKDLDEIKRSELASVMLAFNKVCDKHRAAEKQRKKLKGINYEGNIRALLDIQYDKDTYADIMASDYEDMCSLIERVFDTLKKLEYSLEKLKSSRWIFACTMEEKNKFLTDFFGEQIDSNIAEIINNFYFTGYKLLYYAIKDEITVKADEIASYEIEVEGDGNDDLYDKINEEYYHSVYETLNDIYRKCEDNKAEYWKDSLMDFCNERIKEICADMDEYDRLKILWSLRGSRNPDRNSDFFWDNVSEESLDKHCIKQG